MGQTRTVLAQILQTGLCGLIDKEKTQGREGGRERKMAEQRSPKNLSNNVGGGVPSEKDLTVIGGSHHTPTSSVGGPSYAGGRTDGRTVLLLDKKPFVFFFLFSLGEKLMLMA